MNKVHLDFVSLASVDEETEKIEFDVDAQYVEYDDLKIISYMEPSLEEKDVFTKISYNNNELIIERNGIQTNKMVFVKDGRSFGTYVVNNMRMNLDINVIKMDITENLIELKYELSFVDDKIAVFEIKIKLIW
ncbi:uncharacterized beta-barrel protein YwiB (DUF1934 family) [Bacilli bacterium PM5-3]|nr:uncharacterized beta-barrel protein YwiB (DUF1934 family) [Bacilli bacterium PM5-3]MDH6603915.1 uncharacterized beta-barrel protein YwiB (DUF1934 family) [Bacilli bacterium PM5-9]